LRWRHQGIQPVGKIVEGMGGRSVGGDVGHDTGSLHHAQLGSCHLREAACWNQRNAAFDAGFIELTIKRLTRRVIRLTQRRCRLTVVEHRFVAHTGGTRATFRRKVAIHP